MADISLLDIRVSKKVPDLPGGRVTLEAHHFRRRESYLLQQEVEYALLFNGHSLGLFPDVKDDQEAIIKGLDAIGRVMKLFMNGETSLEVISAKLWEGEQ